MFESIGGRLTAIRQWDRLRTDFDSLSHDFYILVNYLICWQIYTYC